MRISRRGEKGFTLIELLIVVAILGVLAAVVIPNVGRFIGRGESEAADTERTNVQTAVIAMMTDNNLSVLPNGYVDGSVINATANMSAFPHSTAVLGTAKVNDPDGDAYSAGDKVGFILYGHDIDADGSANTTVNYVATEITKGTYSTDSSGTITQVSDGY